MTKKSKAAEKAAESEETEKKVEPKEPEETGNKAAAKKSATVPEEDETGKNEKFIGGYVDFETVILLKQDAKREKRTLSKHLEYLILLGLRLRGHDVSGLDEMIQYNREFQLVEKFLEWKKYN